MTTLTHVLQDCEHYQQQIYRDQYFQQFQVLVYFHCLLNEQYHHLLTLLVSNVPSYVVNHSLNWQGIHLASDVIHFVNDHEPNSLAPKCHQNVHQQGNSALS